MFRYIYLSCLLFWGIAGFSQQKYQSLLWEISGNGLEEPSYLYGTMHVSERIAFRLSDAFFEKINATDAIALESNPENWMREIQNSPEFYQAFNTTDSYGFYNQFILPKIEKEDLINVLRINDFFIDGILYRNYNDDGNYQENTYLDMFLYQTGRQTKRDIISLEDFRESYILALQAADKNQNHQPTIWLQEKLQTKNVQQLLEDAYRTKNLDLIDSLNVASNSKAYLDLMFTKRNANMVKEMHKIIAKTSLFAGVGAAHLPGEEGMIEMLRDLGYSVEPIISEYTEEGIAEKKKIENSYLPPALNKETLSDGMLAYKAPDELYDFSMEGIGALFSLDMPNSIYLSTYRIPLRDYLRPNGKKTTLEQLDSLYFENIPGEILSKKQVTVNGFQGWEIKNKTIEGNRQHYIQILTPLELITLIYSGKKSDIEYNEQEIFESLELKPIQESWEILQPAQGGFEVNMPSYAAIAYNSDFALGYSDPIIEAFDPSDNSSYFLVQQTLNDTQLLEDASFELERIGYKFLNALEVDTLNSSFLNETTFRTQGEIDDNNTVSLQVMLNGNHYYLMGTTSQNEQNKATFFNSFKPLAFNYSKPVLHQDSVLNFSVYTDQPTSQYKYEYLYDTDEINHFAGDIETRIFNSNSKQKITVTYEEFGKYQYYDNLDSLLDQRINSFEKRSSVYSEEEARKNVNGWEQLDVFFRDTSNYQKVKVRYLQKADKIYTISALLNANSEQEDEFVSKFYDSFKPNEIESEINPFQSKEAYFFEDIYSEADSIQYSAWASMYWLNFDESHVNQLINIYKTYNFDEEDDSNNKTNLLKKIGAIESQTATQFLIEEYKSAELDSDTQVSILEALARNPSEEKYKQILSLLEYDLPLPSDTYSLRYLFDQFGAHHEYSKQLYPDVFQFFPIQEYKQNVVDFTATLVDSSALKVKLIEKQKKPLLTSAKLELKRVNSRLNNDYAYYNSYNDLVKLKSYLSLLSYFQEDRSVQELFDKVKGIENQELDIFLLEQSLKNKAPVKEDISRIINSEDVGAKFEIYKVLFENDQLNQFPKTITQDELVESHLMSILDFNLEKDTIIFLKKQEIVRNDETSIIYFYKTSQEPKEDYLQREWYVNAIAYAKDEKGNLEPILKSSRTQIPYFSDKDLKGIYKKEIDRMLHGNKQRVIIENYGYSGYGGYYY